MSFARIFMWIAVLTGMVTAGSAAMAGPVRCSVSNQDSTCVGHLTTAWQTPPMCPNQLGWTTAAPARWIGSQYSAPQCNYQAPPTCANGFNQTSAPSWNGSSWVGLGCAAPPPALPGTAQLASVCESAIAAEMARAGFNGTNGTYRGVWGALQGPYTLGGGQVYPPGMFAGMGGSMRGGQGPGDFYYVRDLGNPSAGGATGGNGIGVCWFQSGSANITGYDYLEDLSYDGG
ncbi:hypothetical protein CUJ91_32765 (plasmid) [Paraburkholderia graminis]|nr:hypothetical protein CUJ91_32765 [Paraburkholderia graminis]